jgi:broad specificity phosphatase PhoE
MKLVLIRHAQTSANVDRVWHGHTDTPLTNLGQEQVDSLADHFHHVMEPTVIYSSPLVRTRKTAEAIANKFDLEVKIEAELIEFGVGEYENVSFDKLNGELNFFPRMIADEHYSAPGGENRYKVTKRVTSRIESIAEKHQDENIVIVTHGMALSFALTHWFGDENTKWSDYVSDNTAVTEISLNPHDLIRFNESNHLQGDLRERSNLLSERIKNEKD